MTRIKIFFGVTTAALAIAGLAAAKRTGSAIKRFYKTANGSACNCLPSICLQNSGTITCLGTYTDGHGNFKIGALFTQGSKCPPAFQGTCRNKVVWDGQQ